jgi:hypothetical protein
VPGGPGCPLAGGRRRLKPVDVGVEVADEELGVGALGRLGVADDLGLGVGSEIEVWPAVGFVQQAVRGGEARP